MTSVLTLPYAGPLTVADLEQTPEDGYRYELLDGVLVVTSSPSVAHQRVVGNLHVQLRAACPRRFEVFVAPLDVVLAEDSLVVPDLIVVDRIDNPGKRIPALPLLAIEVISPSSRGFDLMLKRDRLERAGIPSYWVVDPLDPRLIAWDFRDGRYVEVADVRREESFTATLPYPVSLTPSALVTP